MATLQCAPLLSSSVAAETSTSSSSSTILPSPSASAFVASHSATPIASQYSTMLYSDFSSLYRRGPTHIGSSFVQTNMRNFSSNLSTLDKKLVRAPVQAQQVKFKAKREVTIPFREGAFPANDYLKETERIVQVTFPDSARIEYLGDQKWRSRLRPITFFSVSATPSVEMRVTFEKGALRLHSNKLFLDFSGVPDNFAVADFSFSLNGNLRVIPRPSQVNQARRSCDFAGSVSLGLATDLPLAFALIPEGIVTRVGDEILDRIIGAMEGALLQGIITDYNTWCRKNSKRKAVIPPPQPAVPLRTSTS